MDESAGLRELRQQASELVRQAEGGHTILVTVSGRAVAQLGPVVSDRWRTWEQVRRIFDAMPDDDWAADRDYFDQSLRDPFERYDA